ncbi:MAG: hypothetical protein HY673_10690 [Chloroflexi bacterium]|nr:hypothetical protein [Chloroflexota bacterium]
MRLAHIGLAILSLLLGIFIIVYSLVQTTLSVNLGLLIGIMLLLNGSLRLWMHHFRKQRQT